MVYRGGVQFCLKWRIHVPFFVWKPLSQLPTHIAPTSPLVRPPSSLSSSRSSLVITGDSKGSIFTWDYEALGAKLEPLIKSGAGGGSKVAVITALGRSAPSKVQYKASLAKFRF